MKKWRILLSTFLLVFLYFFNLQVQNSYAWVSPDKEPFPKKDFPPPQPIPCNQIAPDNAYNNEEEFHSLRPYQMSPCDPKATELALFCGTNMTFTEWIKVLNTSLNTCHCYPSPTEPKEVCVCQTECRCEGPQVICNYDVHVENEYAINPTEPSGGDANHESVELPIMGNTEDVINSYQQPNPEPIMDAKKVNEYVSWYLNGTINRAEYPYLDVEPRFTEIHPVPLLPFITLKHYDGPGPDTLKVTDYSGPLRKLLSHEIQDRIRSDEIKQAEATVNDMENTDPALQRHDQVVGCTYGFHHPLFPNFDLMIGPCHLGGWKDILSGLFGVKKEWRMTDWYNTEEGVDHLPPMPDPEQYDSFIRYWVDYRRWRGQSCLLFEINDHQYFICVDNVFKPNYWSNLFPYVPFSSTEDILGELGRNPDTWSMYPISPGLNLTGKDVVERDPADLFIPHMKENTELAETLQKTYVSKDITINPEETVNVLPQTPPECDLRQVRTNPGDNVFPGELLLTNVYDAHFSCTYTNACCGPEGCWGCCPIFEVCTKWLGFEMDMQSRIPKAQEAFSRFVAGPQSVFQRIYPKIGENAPVEGIYDIPAYAGIDYGFSEPDINLESKENPAPRQNEPLEIYYPHIGSIHQYFLKCIQTALRPRGFAEPCPQGESVGEGEVPPPPSGTCPTVDIGEIPETWRDPMRSNFIRLADAWGGAVCNLAEECYNYVVKESLARNVNPSFSLMTWLNESGASNYCSYPGVQDFGINISGMEENLVSQLNFLLQLPFSDSYTSCRNVPGFAEPMHAFLARFAAGGCDPNNQFGIDTYCARVNTWQWVNEPRNSCTDVQTPDICGNGGVGFSIEWPDDRSCP